ncbi:MAG: MFS transporter [Nitrosomonas sp.]|nr:MFS transporter [Nitrosomonas sp.]
MRDWFPSLPKQRGFRLLTTRDFSLLWWAQVISQIGDGITKVALLWFVYQMTGSVLKMTIIGVLQTIPPLLLCPLIGVYIDRLPKKFIMIFLDISRAILIALIPFLHTFNLLTLEVLYVLVLFIAVFSAGFGPALTSVVPLLVKKSDLMPANALIQCTTNVGVLLGPAMGGFFIAFIGVQNVLYLDAATFLCSGLCLMLLRVPQTQESREYTATKNTVKQDLREGFQFVFSQQRIILEVIFMTMLFTLGASTFVYVLPVFVENMTDIGPTWLGWLWSAMGAGMLLTSIVLTWVRQMNIHARLRFIAGSMVIGGMAVYGLMFMPSPLVAVFLVGLVGGSTAMFNPLMWSLIQEVTPDYLMGRVFSFVNTSAMASASAGMIAFGWMADVIGAAVSIGFVGLIFFITAVVTLFISRRASSHALVMS